MQVMRVPCLMKCCKDLQDKKDRHAEKVMLVDEI